MLKKIIFIIIAVFILSTFAGCIEENNGETKSRITVKPVIHNHESNKSGTKSTVSTDNLAIHSEYFDDCDETRIWFERTYKNKNITTTISNDVGPYIKGKIFYSEGIPMVNSKSLHIFVSKKRDNSGVFRIYFIPHSESIKIILEGNVKNDNTDAWIKDSKYNVTHLEKESNSNFYIADYYKYMENNGTAEYAKPEKKRTQRECENIKDAIKEISREYKTHFEYIGSEDLSKIP